MVKKTKGPRQATRKAFRKAIREKPMVNQFLKEFSVGEHVAIDVEPSSHRALQHRHALGKTGTVVGRRGDAYVIEIFDGGKRKTLFVTPEHLNRS